MDEQLRNGRGVIVAALTPFTGETTSVDYGKFSSQLEAIMPHAPQGVSVGAVESQEFQVLQPESRLRLVATACEILGSHVPVVAGVSSPSLSESIAMAKQAQQLGAAAVLGVASQKPWGAPPLADEAYGWFSRLADRSPLPLFVYNNPRLGVDLDVEVLTKICAHDNVVGVKETSRDGSKLLALIAHVEPFARVFTNMELLFSTLLLGGSGAMLPTPGLPVASRIMTALAGGDLDAGAEWSKAFGDFPRKWMRRGLLPIMKAASRLMGCDVGDPLWPHEALDAEETERLEEFLDSWGLLGALRVPGSAGSSVTAQEGVPTDGS